MWLNCVFFLAASRPFSLCPTCLERVWTYWRSSWTSSPRWATPRSRKCWWSSWPSFRYVLRWSDTSHQYICITCLWHWVMSTSKRWMRSTPCRRWGLWSGEPCTGEWTTAAGCSSGPPPSELFPSAAAAVGFVVRAMASWSGPLTRASSTSWPWAASRGTAQPAECWGPARPPPSPWATSTGRCCARSGLWLFTPSFFSPCRQRSLNLILFSPLRAWWWWVQRWIPPSAGCLRPRSCCSFTPRPFTKASRLPCTLAMWGKLPLWSMCMARLVDSYQTCNGILLCCCPFLNRLFTFDTLCLTGRAEDWREGSGSL